MSPELRLVFWETTTKCNLACQHCRVIPEEEEANSELTTEEAFRFVDFLAQGLLMTEVGLRSPPREKPEPRDGEVADAREHLPA